MQADIIQKYNRPVPRYTSYPPANFFAPLSEADYLRAVEESNAARQNQISFYVHVPFCRHLCHYCGCNSYPMGRTETVQAYVDALHREMDRVAQYIDKSRKISQIHYGGGSPTALPVPMIKELTEHMLSLFPVIERPEIAIECHPGYLTENDWMALTECGFTRYSLGVQDFREEVLKTSGRRPSLLPMEEILRMLRGSGATVNMDFIYGLPKQSAESFRETMRQAAALRPDRLVTFAYAHLPMIFPRQKVLDRAGLPADEEKNQMFEEAARILQEAGYKPVGLDHFVLPDDELAQALAQGRLHRNFQGYCTRRTTAQVYAFGVTGISQLDDVYAQNGRDIQEYIRTINDENVMEMALVENIQREDLNAIEIALAYEHLLQQSGMTQEKVSERVGKSRTAITNYLRLLKLPAQVQMALQKKEIDMGHARALLAVDSPSLQIKLFKEIQKHGYSVRKVEEMAQQLKNGEDIITAKNKAVSKEKLPEEFNLLRNRLAQFFQTKVQMTCSPKGKGKITIQFDNEEQLERIMNALDGANG